MRRGDEVERAALVVGAPAAPVVDLAGEVGELRVVARGRHSPSGSQIRQAGRPSRSGATVRTPLRPARREQPGGWKIERLAVATNVVAPASPLAATVADSTASSRDTASVSSRAWSRDSR